MNHYLTPGVYIKTTENINIATFESFAVLFLTFEVENITKPIVLKSISDIYKHDFLKDNLMITKSLNIFFENGGDKLYLLSAPVNEPDFESFLSRNCDGLIDLEIIVAPDLLPMNLDNRFEIQNAIAKYSKESYRLCINDIFDLDEIDKLNESIIYYPWIISTTRDKLPPSIYACAMSVKVAKSDGIYVSVANKELRAAIDVTKHLLKEDMELMYRTNINPVIKDVDFVKLYGIRVLDYRDSVNVLRVINHIKRNILYFGKWFVFEPNDETLKETLTRQIESFLFSLWQSGALKGESESEAFKIICDESNNSLADVDAGILNVDIAISITKPLEFILIHLTKTEATDNQASITIL